jgi:hypothetical protein
MIWRLLCRLFFGGMFRRRRREFIRREVRRQVRRELRRERWREGRGGWRGPRRRWGEHDF